MTIELLHDKDYTDYDMKTKMLSFYFTFFELLSTKLCQHDFEGAR
jgi:hypothetical protein